MFLDIFAALLALNMAMFWILISRGASDALTQRSED
jgi:hypothetical protein